MNIIAFLYCFLLTASFTSCDHKKNTQPHSNEKQTEQSKVNSLNLPIQVGAEQINSYIPLLKGKRVGVVVNQTSVVHHEHLVDFLLSKEIKVKKVFAPEHGFRGNADAGETVKNGVDKKTMLPIISLYGKNKKPKQEQLSDIDIIVFDIQDVGARFYTYISTLEYVMESCAENNKPIVVLDRPNPNGHYVDGPVLKPEFKSFVGMQSIPVIHGMTVGEYANFLNGEKLLKDGVQAQVIVVPCQNYTHSTSYDLPIAPSPNLPNNQAIALYPSLCFFEGTTLSIGRGTTNQFQIIGHPNYIGEFEFTPVSMRGAKSPKHQNKTCKGISLTNVAPKNQLDLSYFMNAYNHFQANNIQFFNTNNFINKLAGYDFKSQVKQGFSEKEIRASWQKDIEIFKHTRKKYLLYPDFE